MKKQLWIGILIAVVLSFFPLQTNFAQSTEDPDLPRYKETDEGLPVCLPGVYLIQPIDCLPFGPSTTLTDWARKGLTLPLKPLPAIKPDSSLVEIDQKYAKLNLQQGEQAAFYPSLEAAVAGVGASHRLKPSHLLYIVYDKQINVNGGHYLQVEHGDWVRASPTSYSSFQGLLFIKQPTNDFGWIIENDNPRYEPSHQAEEARDILERETVVQVYDKVESENTTWYMIGLGKWVEQRYIRVIEVQNNPPDGVNNNRWIEINLLQQTISVYDGGKLIFASLIATGINPYYTKPGLFTIYEKKELDTMAGSFEEGKTDYYYLENVPWTMYYDEERALHGAYWRALFGYPQSHGCVNLSVGDAHWLFLWANEGDWVHVWDPSGKTPTDPSFY